MNTPTTDFLLKLEGELEADIRDCLRLLELGREEALQELRTSKDELGTSLASARHHLLQTVKASEQQVESIQRNLGKLAMALHQFVMTDPLQIEDLSGFDTWSREVLAAFETAREELNRIQSREESVWKARLEKAWRRFGQQLEVVKLHLATDREHAREAMEAERERLRDRLSQLRGEIERDPRNAREILQQLAGARQDDPEISRLEGWFKALLMWIDSPASDRKQDEDRETRNEDLQAPP